MCMPHPGLLSPLTVPPAGEATLGLGAQGDLGAQGESLHVKGYTY
jgi:hypothetical protein